MPSELAACMHQCIKVRRPRTMHLQACISYSSGTRVSDTNAHRTNRQKRLLLIDHDKSWSYKWKWRLKRDAMETKTGGKPSLRAFGLETEAGMGSGCFFFPFSASLLQLRQEPRASVVAAARAGRWRSSGSAGRSRRNRQIDGGVGTGKHIRLLPY